MFEILRCRICEFMCKFIRLNRSRYFKPLGLQITLGSESHVSRNETRSSIYYKNPELCSLRCGDEFGLELNWNGAPNPVYYNSVGELGRLACLYIFFFASSRITSESSM